ncbi:hypothetical protein HC766_06030 [Candidatus Gracilibacteria bacterium]|nr:hypothetical protein [Candidatus Gracilibacteria bacterium]
MLGEETYLIWAKEFSPNTKSWVEGSWEEGSKIKFLAKDKNGISGMTSEIAENKQYKFVSIRHLGYVLNGVEDTTSPEITALMPSYENYSFEQLDENTTKLRVYMDSDPKYTEMFQELWPKALTKLKEICES